MNEAEKILIKHIDRKPEFVMVVSISNGQMTADWASPAPMFVAYMADFLRRSVDTHLNKNEAAEIQAAQALEKIKNHKGEK